VPAVAAAESPPESPRVRLYSLILFYTPVHKGALCSSPFTLGYISESGGIDNCFANCYSLRLENHNVIGHRFANGELVINSSKTGMKRLGKKIVRPITQLTRSHG
jgi:hypothetical protein